MGAYRLSYLPGIGRQAADKETSLNADAPFDLARLLNHGDACQPAPGHFLFQPVKLAADNALARLNAPVSGISLAVGVADRYGYGLGRLCLQKQADIVIERALIALERQNIIGALVPNLFRNAALTTHRINRDGVPRDIEQIKQGWNRRNLIGFFGHFLLRQDQPGICSKGTDHVDRRRPGAGVSTVA